MVQLLKHKSLPIQLCLRNL